MVNQCTSSRQSQICRPKNLDGCWGRADNHDEPNSTRDSVQAGKTVVVQVNFASLGYEPNTFLQSSVLEAVLPIHDWLKLLRVATGHSSLCP